MALRSTRYRSADLGGTNHAYFIYLKEARRLSRHSIDAPAATMGLFKNYTRYRDFKQFHTQQAVGFKRRLAEQVSQRTGDRLSKGTLLTTLDALRAFFHWLAGQPGCSTPMSSGKDGSRYRRSVSRT